ncbi:uncharacterized protein Triagg1_3412 [Trichoderma aggressivum f. europaeum]|uniref:Uncharacterized protein n=1 Tax=Trichoderma aggressivum f. europaeum TaxID=173218 RepID=A0AAE1M6S9_9HYPO|nr:hypothetical protein Triagg1_3412 [Trichoderma aggressivum f. europaeum]
MKRPSTDCHSAHDEARPAKTRQRTSNVAMTQPSTITVNENGMHTGIEPETRHHDSGPDLDQLQYTKPKATAYLNSRAEELSQREIAEPSPLEMFKNPYNYGGSFAIAQLIFRKTKSPARKFDDLIEAINDAMDKALVQKRETIIRDELNQDKYADRIIRALGYNYDRSLVSHDMKWLNVLCPVFRMTASTEVSEAHKEQWRKYIGSALKENQIDWVLGVSKSYLTAMITHRIVSNEESQERIIAMSSLAHTHKITSPEDRGYHIDFGCNFPLENGLPAGLVEGFKRLQENSNANSNVWGPPKPGLINHYNKALSLLEEFQSEPEVELLLMLALTVGMTLDMTIYTVPKRDAKDEVARFAIASSSVKHKRGGTRVALLALRMLWYLMPKEFVWTKAKGEELKIEEETMYSTQRVREATSKCVVPLLGLQK